MSIDLFFFVLDADSQTAAVNAGLAAGILVIAALLAWTALEWRKHRREVQARAVRAAARARMDAGYPAADAEWQRIIAALEDRDR